MSVVSNLTDRFLNQTELSVFNTASFSCQNLQNYQTKHNTNDAVEHHELCLSCSQCNLLIAAHQIRAIIGKMPDSQKFEFLKQMISSLRLIDPKLIGQLQDSLLSNGLLQSKDFIYAQSKVNPGCEKTDRIKSASKTRPINIQSNTAQFIIDDGIKTLETDTYELDSVLCQIAQLLSTVDEKWVKLNLFLILLREFKPIMLRDAILTGFDDLDVEIGKLNTEQLSAHEKVKDKKHALSKAKQRQPQIDEQFLQVMRQLDEAKMTHSTSLDELIDRLRSGEFQSDNRYNFTQSIEPIGLNKYDTASKSLDNSNQLRLRGSCQVSNSFFKNLTNLFVNSAANPHNSDTVNTFVTSREEQEDTRKIDFIRRLPIQVSKRIILLLDELSTRRAINVSTFWRHVINQVRQDAAVKLQIRDEILMLQGLTANLVNPNFASDTDVPVPKLAPDNSQTVLLKAEDESETRKKPSLKTASQTIRVMTGLLSKQRPSQTTKSVQDSSSLELAQKICIQTKKTGIKQSPIILSRCSMANAYKNFVTKKVIMEERNVYCGSYSVLVVHEGPPQNKIDPHRAITSIVTKKPTVHRLIAYGSSNCVIGFIDMERMSASQRPATSMANATADASANNSPPRKKLHGHAGSIKCLQFLKDGQWLLSGSYDTSVRLWDTNTGRCLRIFRGHTGTVLSLHCPDPPAFTFARAAADPAHLDDSADSNLFASCGADQTCRVWKIQQKSCVMVCRHAAAKVTAVAMHYPLCVSGDTTGLVKVWNIVDSTLIKTLEGHTAEVTSLKLDRYHILSASRDSYVLVWSAIADFSKCLGSFRHPKAVLSMEFLYLRAITGCEDGRIRIWNILTGNCCRIIRGNSRSDPILHLSAPDEDLLVLNTSWNMLSLTFEKIKWDYSSENDQLSVNDDDNHALSKDLSLIEQHESELAHTNLKNSTTTNRCKSATSLHAYQRAQRARMIEDKCDPRIKLADPLNSAESSAIGSHIQQFILTPPITVAQPATASVITPSNNSFSLNQSSKLSSPNKKPPISQVSLKSQSPKKIVASLSPSSTLLQMTSDETQQKSMTKRFSYAFESSGASAIHNMDNLSVSGTASSTSMTASVGGDGPSGATSAVSQKTGAGIAQKPPPSAELTNMKQLIRNQIRSDTSNIRVQPDLEFIAQSKNRLATGCIQDETYRTTLQLKERPGSGPSRIDARNKQTNFDLSKFIQMIKQDHGDEENNVSSQLSPIINQPSIQKYENQLEPETSKCAISSKENPPIQTEYSVVNLQRIPSAPKHRPKSCHSRFTKTSIPEATSLVKTSDNQHYLQGDATFHMDSSKILKRSKTSLAIPATSSSATPSLASTNRILFNPKNMENRLSEKRNERERMQKRFQDNKRAASVAAGGDLIIKPYCRSLFLKTNKDTDCYMQKIEKLHEFQRLKTIADDEKSRKELWMKKIMNF